MGEPPAANARTGTYGLALSGAGLRSVTDPSRRRFWIAEGGRGHDARTVQPIKEETPGTLRYRGLCSLSVVRRGPPEAQVPGFAQPLRWRSPGGRRACRPPGVISAGC